MTAAEAVAGCEFWTTNVAGTAVFGLTSDERIGEKLNGTPVVLDEATDRRGWAITLRCGSPGGADEVSLYKLAVAETNRRAQESRGEIAA